MKQVDAEKLAALIAEAKSASRALLNQDYYGFICLGESLAKAVKAVENES